MPALAVLIGKITFGKEVFDHLRTTPASETIKLGERTSHLFTLADFQQLQKS